jgi:hypothetical protein
MGSLCVGLVDIGTTLYSRDLEAIVKHLNMYTSLSQENFVRLLRWSCLPPRNDVAVSYRGSLLLYRVR